MTNVVLRHPFGGKTLLKACSDTMSHGDMAYLAATGGPWFW